MKRQILLMSLLALFTGFSAGAQDNPDGCLDFRYYLANFEDGESNIYGIEINGNDAEMTWLKTLDYGLHIAYNPSDNLLYIVRSSNGSFRTLDVSVVDGALSAETALDISASSCTAAGVNNDGDLVIGSGGTNTVYVVSADGTTDEWGDANVSGGDLVVRSNGEVVLATNNGNYLQLVMMGDAEDPLIGPGFNGSVTGLALTDSEDYLYSSNGSSELTGKAADGTDNGVSYTLTLDGEAFPHNFGDLSSACLDAPPVEECDNFSFYLADSPVGAGSSDIYGAQINGGNAELDYLASVDYQAHLAFNENAGELYIVNRNNGSFETYDINSGTLVGPTTLNPALQNVASAVVSPDGKLILGSESANAVYEVEIASGNASPLAGEAITNMFGGDLVYGSDGVLYYASRPGGGQLIDVMTNVSVGNLPNNVTGAALTSDGNIMTSSRNFSDLRVYGPQGSANELAIYTTTLDGDPYPVAPADLASGCADTGGPQISFEGPCYPSELLAFNQGPDANGNAIGANRSDALQALGEPDANNEAGGFVSLGVGGSITLGFPGIVPDEPGDDIEIYETSFSGDVCGASDDESAIIELSQDGVNWVDMGSICRDGAVDIAGSGLDYVVAIRISNNDDETNTLDGYDLDGVIALSGCGNIPSILCSDPGECYATSADYIEGSSFGGGSIAANRTNALNSVGEPQRADFLNFTSLGYGGSITFQFDGVVLNEDGDDIEVVETTYGNPGCESYREYADVSVSVDGIDFFYIGTVCKSDPFVDISDADLEFEFSCVNYVRVANNDDLSFTPDAYDVDGIVALHNCPEEDNGENAGLKAGQVQKSPIVLEAYPNPTEGQAVIQFSTDITERVTLEVIDMNGGVVKQLFNQEAQAGNTYRTEFNGLNLPNGVYIARLITGNNVEIEKIMIAR